MRPILLDLFCGAGGAAMGYKRAGFEVIGVDINPQPNYPFSFHQMDAMNVLKTMTGVPAGGLTDYYWKNHGMLRAIHASPPCQKFTVLNNDKSKHVDLIAPVREALIYIGLPWVIENVPGAPLIDPVKLCGSYFGLKAGDRYLQRHRLFESNIEFEGVPCMHPEGKYAVGVYGGGKWDNNTSSSSKRRGGYQGTRREKIEAMDINWMKEKELVQAVPPAYTEYIGKQLINHI